MIKKLFTYWLPPLAWMGFIFPANDTLSINSTSRIIVPILKWLVPHSSQMTIETLHVLIRKLSHFGEYALLAFLLYRAFRGIKGKNWNPKCVIYAGIVALSYGCLDEYLQNFVPFRTGSIHDWLIDSVGAIFALTSVSLQNRNHAEFTHGPVATIPDTSLAVIKLGEPFLKRPFDFLLSLSGIAISFPLWVLIAFFVKSEDRGPVFYKQARVGKKGRIFEALKFRSMIPDAEKHTGTVWAIENDPRVTKVGRILRATAMDELPQLLNILRGDMSFVGPRAERPELVKEFAQRIKNYHQRFFVRPGLTGLAQVYGRYDTPPEHKLKYEILYIKNQSFLFDMKLIFLSFWITFQGKWESREKKF